MIRHGRAAVDEAADAFFVRVCAGGEGRLIRHLECASQHILPRQQNQVSDDCPELVDGTLLRASFRPFMRPHAWARETVTFAVVVE